MLPPHVCTRHVRAALPVSRGAAGPRPRAPLRALVGRSARRSRYRRGAIRSVHLAPSRPSDRQYFSTVHNTARRVCVCLCVLVCASLRSSRGETQLTGDASRSPKLPGVPAPRTGHIGHGSWADRGATWGITELSLTYTSVHLGVTEARATSAMAARARLPLQRPAPQRPATATAAGPHAPSRTWLRRSCS